MDDIIQDLKIMTRRLQSEVAIENQKKKKKVGKKASHLETDTKIDEVKYLNLSLSHLIIRYLGRTELPFQETPLELLTPDPC
jgi:hypothetical protein